jgi:hypothetical protein
MAALINDVKWQTSNGKSGRQKSGNDIPLIDLISNSIGSETWLFFTQRL